MSTNYQVVVYGASGYTGKLTAWKLAERGVPFIAAGRNAERLQMELDKVPELKGADYRCVAVTPRPEGAGRSVRRQEGRDQHRRPVHAVGPAGCGSLPRRGLPLLRYHGRDGLGANAQAGVWPEVQGKDLALCRPTPTCGPKATSPPRSRWRRRAIDTLDIVYLGDSPVSEASTASFLRMCTNPQHYLANNELVMWPYATSYNVTVPGEVKTFAALPWSGGGEPLWYQDDPRVRTAVCWFPSATSSVRRRFRIASEVRSGVPTPAAG